MKTKKTLGFCAMAFTLLACLFPRAGEAVGHGASAVGDVGDDLFAAGVVDAVDEVLEHHGVVGIEAVERGIFGVVVVSESERADVGEGAMDAAVVDEAGCGLAQRVDFSYVHSRKSSDDKRLGQKSCRGLFFDQNVSNDKFHERVEGFVAHDYIVFGAQGRNNKR